MTSSPQQLATELAARFDRIFGSLGVLGVHTTALLEPRFGRHEIGPFDQGDITRMRDLAYAMLDSNPVVAGAGTIFDPARVAVADQCIQWHVRGKDGYEPYQFDFDPASPSYYDFLQLPWYSVPRDEHRAIVYGPYLDYLGVDEFILTCSIPLMFGGRFAGAATCDIGYSEFERTFLELARGIDAQLALVNLDGRICCTTSSRFLPGDEYVPANDITVIDLPTSVPTLRVISAPRPA